MSRRTAGSRWRVLVHDAKGRTLTHARHFSSFHMASADRESDYATYQEFPDTEFDEVVIGRWCHIEAMDHDTWWMNIAGVTIWVTADRDGKPKQASVYMPGTYDIPVEGCKYDLDYCKDYDE